MRRPIGLLALVLVLTSCAGLHGNRPVHAVGVSAGGHITAKPIATGLNYPAAFTFAPSGNIFYGEKDTGRIVVLDPKTGAHHLFFRIQGLPGTSGSERGLLGIALHPGYPKTPFVYAYVTRQLPGGAIDNELVRLRSANGRGTDLRVLFKYTLTSATNHNGGRIKFGYDGMLYAVVGENANPANSQHLHNPRGKVLRMTPAGRPAPGNPFGNRVYSFGLRNSFGFAFDPLTHRLWETEAGPDCNDEVNRIVKGGNFGWGPKENCGGPSPQDTNNSGPTPRILPKRWYTPVITPTGIAFCRRCGLGSASRGTFFFGNNNYPAQIRRVRLTSNRLGIASVGIVSFTGALFCCNVIVCSGHAAPITASPFLNRLSSSDASSWTSISTRTTRRSR